MLSAVCHLLFANVRDNSALAASQSSASLSLAFDSTGICNVHAARVFLDAFTGAENNFDLQKDILYLLRDIFQLDTRTSRFTKLGSLKPFQILFANFDVLPTRNKSIIVQMLEETLTKGEVQLDEIRACCSLIMKSKSRRKRRKKNQQKLSSILLHPFRHSSFHCVAVDFELDSLGSHANSLS
jgi:hypothetical protein